MSLTEDIEVGFYFEELVHELQSEDKECVYLNLIKLLRMPIWSILDPSNYYLLHRQLRNMCLFYDDGCTDILFSIRDKFDECFTLEFPHQDFNQDYSRIISSSNHQPKDLVAALLEACDFNPNNHIDLCYQFINHESGVVRCAALELYQYNADSQNIQSMIHLLTERNPKVLKFAIRFLERFGLDQVVACLSNMIKSNNSNSKITAIKSLARLETNSKIVSLLSDASEFGLESIRLLAIKALALHATPDSIQVLRELQNDINIEICETARISIEKMEQINSQKILIKNKKLAFSEK